MITSDYVRAMASYNRWQNESLYGAADEEYRSAYLARVRGETDTAAWWDYITTRGKRWSSSAAPTMTWW